MAPLYEGMPPTDRTFETEFGQIRCGGDCRDDSDYDRIVAFQNRGGQILHLQKAATRSLEKVESMLKYPVTVTGSNRSCEYQAQLYASDSNRFAHPAKTAHTRGLAIDVSTALPKTKQAAIRKKLLANGWHQSRPTDEPWHYSFGIKV